LGLAVVKEGDFPLIRMGSVITTRRVPYLPRTPSVESHLKCCHSSC